MARPARPTSAPTFADRNVGDTVRLAEDVPIRHGWLRDGDIVCITGVLSGGWRLVRAWSELDGWSDPVAVPETARIATVIPHPDRSAADIDVSKEGQ